MADRRAFLHQLAALPLVGGGVKLIGAPTAAAVPVTAELLDAYDEWLDLERSWLLWQRFGAGDAYEARGAPVHAVFLDKRTGDAWTSRRVTNLSGFDHRNVASRAAVVLSAAGLDLTAPNRFGHTRA